MTEAGWTREKPTAEGWYWRKFLYCHVEHVEVCRVQKFGEIGGELGVWERGAVKDLTGLWLGPISPTDRQQGRVASCEWTYDDIDDYYETACKNAYCLADGTLKDNDHKYCPYCGGLIQLAQQAQEGK